MNIIQLVARVFVFLCFTSVVLIAHAQTVVSEYRIRDELTGKVFQENIDLLYDPKYPGIITTKSVASSDPIVHTTEDIYATPYWWLRIIKAEGQNIYHEEFLSVSPNRVEVGGTSFGYMNVIDTATGKIKESWPLFVAVRAISGVWRVAIFTFFISENRRMEVTRLYSRESYFFPVSQTVKIYKPGIDPESVPLTVKNSDYFEKYLVSSRKN